MNAASQHPPLGQPNPAPRAYSPELLYALPRARARADLGLDAALPFDGVDIWNAYELSWLDERGKPAAALGQLVFPAMSPRIIESKSLKLYLNALSQCRFAAPAELSRTVAADLSAAAGASVTVTLTPASAPPAPLATLPGACLDDLAIDVTVYDVNPALLDGSTEPGRPVSEALHTHLFKSNCPVTGQPDWASVLVRYRGPAIDHGALLRYLISYRNCRAFHEHCVERVFLDLLRRCRPQTLTVYGRYTRRGGLDINPFRSNFQSAPPNLRLVRQ